jgi:hypothetical protein
MFANITLVAVGFVLGNILGLFWAIALLTAKGKALILLTD